MLNKKDLQNILIFIVVILGAWVLATYTAPIPPLGVIPTVFIATPSTTTDSTNFGFLIGTSTNATDNGSTTLAVYGSTTLQTYIDTEFAFQVLNSATTSIFQVDTLNSSTTIRSALTVSDLIIGTCTGCMTVFGDL